MVRADSAPLSGHGLSVRQRSVRRRSAAHPLKTAVRLAVDALFHFKYRASQSKSLWCDTERVWLGSETYLHWALWDADIDIPRLVAAAADAPSDADELRAVVRAELISYWGDQTASLPRRERPRWLPLP